MQRVEVQVLVKHMPATGETKVRSLSRSLRLSIKNFKEAQKIAAMFDDTYRELLLLQMQQKQASQKARR